MIGVDTTTPVGLEVVGVVVMVGLLTDGFDVVRA